ncbi:hypothetical protein BFW38_11695 [Terasakiispira papahanaumokuakeensis]|uniref:Uncharacterized protein n=1 Tax=Terasakiispira papahanaumokuakeensis TaxID=197479 RepID=A0A1E2VAU9_9GAMM|nr:hypothetical protein BFW38_11695 [Terasakiispira papahanaumokuakeensis]
MFAVLMLAKRKQVNMLAHQHRDQNLQLVLAKSCIDQIQHGSTQYSSNQMLLPANHYLLNQSLA